MTILMWTDLVDYHSLVWTDLVDDQSVWCGLSALTDLVDDQSLVWTDLVDEVWYGLTWLMTRVRCGLTG